MKETSLLLFKFIDLIKSIRLEAETEKKLLREALMKVGDDQLLKEFEEQEKLRALSDGTSFKPRSRPIE